MLRITMDCAEYQLCRALHKWYYRFRKHGLAGVTPRRRSDTGHARELTAEQRELLLAIRREHPTTSAALILRTLELDGRLAKRAVSLSTLRRLYREQGLDRVTLRTSDGRVRLRWQAVLVDQPAHLHGAHAEHGCCVLDGDCPVWLHSAVSSTESIAARSRAYLELVRGQ